MGVLDQGMVNEGAFAFRGVNNPTGKYKIASLCITLSLYNIYVVAYR